MIYTRIGIAVQRWMEEKVNGCSGISKNEEAVMQSGILDTGGTRR